MRVEALLEVIQDIIQDLQETGIEKLLSKLTQAMRRQVNEPGDDAQRAVAGLREAIRKSAARSRFNKYPTTQYAILRHIKADELIGEKLVDEVEAAFAGNEITPAIVLTQLEQIMEVVKDIRGEAEKFLSAAEYFLIADDRLDPGTFEIMIAIPREAVEGELVQFGREALAINRIIGVFSEIATGSREPLTIRAISSSDLTVFLDSAPAVAALVATAIERVAALYERVLTIIKMRRDLKTHGVPEDIVSALKKHIDDTVGSGLNEIANQIKKEQFARLDELRRTELETELRKSLRDIAHRLDEGYTFDVRGEPLPVSSEAATSETQSTKAISVALQRVQEARPKLQQFEAESQPILRLSDREKDE